MPGKAIYFAGLLSCNFLSEKLTKRGKWGIIK